jgi:hypothetical protein
MQTLEFLKSQTLAELCAQYSLCERRHSQFPNLVLLNYSQINSPMNEPIVQECRGLILDEADNWRVVCRPYDKFFNYGEPNAVEVDWGTASVYEKLDGSGEIAPPYREIAPAVAAEEGWEVVKSYPLGSWADVLASASAIDPMRGEGYVVCDAQFHRMKVKSPRYVALAHLKEGLSGRRLLDIVRRNESAEFLAHFPEWSDAYGIVRGKFDALCDELEADYDRLKGVEVQKEFAAQALKARISSPLFAMRAGRCRSVREFFATCTLPALARTIGLEVLMTDFTCQFHPCHCPDYRSHEVGRMGLSLSEYGTDELRKGIVAQEDRKPMSISAVTSAFAAFANQVVSGGAASPNTPAAAAKEAAESPVTTAKEAHAGDPVARKKLAKEQAQAQQQQAAEAPAAEPGKGELLDHAA